MKMKQLCLIISILVSFSNIAFSADVEGKVVWSQRIVMSTTVSGVVDEILVDVGDRIIKGEVLLRLQADRFKASMSSAKANKNDAQYKLKEAEREWARAKELYERTVLSDRDLQLAENGLITARATSANASAQYINAQRDFVESVIKAPFDGVVLGRHVQPGQTIITRMSAVPMLSIAATKTYHISGAVTSSYANKLAIGDEVTMTINAKSYNGILVAIGFEPIKMTDTYLVTVKFNADNKLFRSGQRATIHFP